MIDSAANAVESVHPSVIAGRYTVLRVLGRGGMATVYLCEDKQGGGQVAVKVLRQEIGSAVVVERFLREISLASELEHARIPKVLDSGVVDGLPFYVMTYIEGESLRSLLERKKQLTIDEAVRIAGEVIEPTAYAHARGIVHRDLKPENILIAPDGVYVLDFGVARAILESAADRLTSTGVAVGTPAYMSPEQALSDKDLDSRSDVYSLGCVVYEMIAGIPPFVGATAQVVMSRRFVAPAPPLSETRDGVPAGVQHAVAKALARTPADRWQTATEFGAALTAPPLSESVQAVGRHVDQRRVWYMRGLFATIAISVTLAAGVAWKAARSDPVLRAQSAIMSWDFDKAESELRSAVARERNNPEANLWLAQFLMLKQSPAETWRSLAFAAAERRDELGPADQKRVAALSAFASANFPSACQQFDELRRLARVENRDDFTPALAYADCLMLDSTVVPDSRTPTGLRFVASYHLIDSLYGALITRDDPDGRAFQVIMPRLERLLTVDHRVMRQGIIRNERDVIVVAQPAMIGDTLTYIPYRFVPGSGPMSFGDPSSLEAAGRRNQRRLFGFATLWRERQPASPEARETVAGLLEANGDVAGDGMTALSEIVTARRLLDPISRNDAEGYVKHLRLANAHIRNLIRVYRFDDVGKVADSALAWKQPALDEALLHEANEYLWRLAAIRGNVASVIRIEQGNATRHRVWLASGPEVLPAAVSRDVIAITNYAAFGGPGDSITTIMNRLRENVPAVVAPAKLDRVLTAILSRPLVLAAPEIGAKHVMTLGPVDDIMVRAVQAVGASDLRLARLYLDSLISVHAGTAPGAVTMDVTYQKAWLSAAIGDSLKAAEILDNGLRGIAKAPPSMLDQPVLIASLVRAMHLRYVIADATGDSRSAVRWSRAVRALWPHFAATRRVTR